MSVPPTRLLASLPDANPQSYGLQMQPSHYTAPPLSASASVPASASVTTTLSSLLSHPAVQAVGGAVLLVSLLKAAQFIAERYHLLSPSSSSSSPAPRGSSRSTNPYETPTLLHEYLMMHFALPSTLLVHTDVSDIPWAAMHFPAECARECIGYLKRSPQFAPLGADVRVLDVGCAVGRSSFEAARYARTVIGVDFSHAFVAAANELKDSGRKEYVIKVEGDIAQRAVAEVHPSIDRSRVAFYQGDACNLSAISPPLAPVHCVLAANLVCRLPHPLHFLAALPALVLPHGFVLLFSPHTWLEEYTRREEWLGGYYDSDGREVRTAARLREVMEADGKFVLVAEKNVPFFIRETYRKNQWSVSHLTVFQRTERP